jgi:hypothetical protein
MQRSPKKGLQRSDHSHLSPSLQCIQHRHASCCETVIHEESVENLTVLFTSIENPRQWDPLNIAVLAVTGRLITSGA